MIGARLRAVVATWLQYADTSFKPPLREPVLLHMKYRFTTWFGLKCNRTAGLLVNRMATPTYLTDADPLVESMNDLKIRVEKQDIPTDVKEFVEKMLQIREKKETYWRKNTMPDTPNARMISEQTLSIQWAELHKQGKTLTVYESVWMSKSGQGQILQFLMRMQKAKRALEIGMFTGYVAMAMAECLPEDGAVVTCEIDPYLVTTARKEFDKSPFGKKIDIRQGPAMKTLEKLASEGQQFDFIYLDAEGKGYTDYLNKLLDKDILAAGGTLAVDNTFGLGTAYIEPHGNPMDAFNNAVMADSRVDQVMLPLFDGLSLIRRKGE